MQACVKVVAAPSGTGSQTITGVTDRDGNAFQGKLFLIYGNSGLNSLQTFFRQSYGFDDLTHQHGEGSEDSAFAGLKLANTGTAGGSSIVDEQSNFFFGGTVQRFARISASRSGEFDIQYDRNSRTGDSFIVVVLGGDALSALVGRVEGSTNPTITTTFTPVAALFKGQSLFGSSSGTSGGSAMCYGWATNAGEMAASSITVNDGGIATGDNARYQRSTSAIAEMNGVSVIDERAVLAWNADGFQMSGGSSSRIAYAALGGCLAKAGTLTQGDTVITTGLNNRLVILVSVGAPASTAVRTDMAMWTFGLMDGTRQAAYYCGEDVSFDTNALHGARYLSNVDALLIGTPAAGSTTFSAKAQMVSLGNGSFELAWSVNDGSANEVLWLALGDPLVPPDLDLLCPSETAGVIETPFASSLTATGGTAPYTFSLIAGSLPPGLTLAGSTGAISGTPTTVGTYPFTARVTDAAALTFDAACAIVIADVCPRPIIGTVGEGSTVVVPAVVPPTPALCEETAFLLAEDGGHLLLETGGRIALEDSGASTRPTIGVVQ